MNKLNIVIMFLAVSGQALLLSGCESEANTESDVELYKSRMQTSEPSEKRGWVGHWEARSQGFMRIDEASEPNLYRVIIQSSEGSHIYHAKHSGGELVLARPGEILHVEPSSQQAIELAGFSPESRCLTVTLGEVFCQD